MCLFLYGSYISTFGVKNINSPTMSVNPYFILASYILPLEIAENFDLTDVREERLPESTILHLYLDERAIAPDGRIDLKPNGFYEESVITDFPIRDHDTVLHVRRRRWKDANGKSHAKDMHLTAEGTRISEEFATFLKDTLGLLPRDSEVPTTDLPH